MKKFITLLIAIVCCIPLLKAEETPEYHFKEGFQDLADMQAKGWARNCGASASAGFIRGTYGGLYVPKFDQTVNGESKDLISPLVGGAGQLTFWIYTNSATNNLSIHVCTLINGVSSEVKLIPYSEIGKSWTEVVTNINLPAATNLKIRIWAEKTENTSTSSVVIDDIALTKYSSSEPDPDPDPETAIDRIQADFSDGTWGTGLAENPKSGNYTAGQTINGYVFTKADLVARGVTSTDGEKHTSRMAIDKTGSIAFPLLKSIGEIEIHAAGGSVGNIFRLEEFVGDSWLPVDGASFVTRQTPDSTYVFALLRNTETKLRLSNISGGAILIYKVLSRTYQESMELNIVSFIPTEGNTCYYNLTKEISFTFNKEVQKGTGSLTLNGTPISLNDCTIDGKSVCVPVSLQKSIAEKSYSLVIPAGAFTEKDNPANLSIAKTLNFTTYKTVSAPSGYTSLIDVAYLDADPAQNRMDIYYPENPQKPVPVVINIHGGGWNHGEKESQTSYTTYFGMGFAVANVEYRMTPQATAPAAIEDVRSAMVYLINNAEALNIDPNRIVFQGGSAGSHLALTAAYLDQDQTFNPSRLPDKPYKIIAVIDKYGPAKLDDFMFYTSLVKWLGDYADDTDFIKSISPVYMANENSAPTYIVHGDADPTVPYAQSISMDSVLTKKGVKHMFTTVPGGGHGGFSNESETQINNEIKAFLTEILESPMTSCDKNLINTLQLQISGNTILIPVEGKTQTAVYDVCGKRVASSGEKRIVLEKSGIFFVKVITEDNTYICKIKK